MEKINVNDKTITTSRVVKSIEIDQSMEIKLDESATFNVRLLDADGRLVKIERVTMEGSDYSNWSNDDNYVVNFLLTSLGLTEV